jgi:phosphoribosyl-AMP cyclohydrolase
MTTALAEDVRFGPDGLVPAIVQDVRDGRVLMLAWMDAEALAATLETGDVHFHSRSRDRLWRKGEESGNVLRLVGLDADCDQDALLVTADPIGPTCHRGTRSCFDADGAPTARATQGFAGGALVDRRRARGGASGRLVHDLAARWRRGCRGPQGHRGGHRGAPRGQG